MGIRRDIRSTTATSGANSAQTVTVTQPSGDVKIYVWSVTVTTLGADIAADVGIAIKDNAVEKWNAELRNGKVYGGHFSFPAPIPIENGDLTVVVDAGGASVVTECAVVYELI